MFFWFFVFCVSWTFVYHPLVEFRFADKRARPCIDRNVEIGGFEPIQAWTKFDFPGRKGKHSTFTWNKDHFSGVDYDERTKEVGVIRRFEGKSWAEDADKERGNYDYL